MLGLLGYRGFSLVAASQGYSPGAVSGLSLRWLLLLPSTGSRVSGSVAAARERSSCGSWALEHRLNSCGAQG